MLTPDELEVLPRQISNIYTDLEEYVISDIARRIAGSDALTETAIHQIQALKGLGYSQRDIDKEIARATGLAEAELDALYDDAVKRGQKFNDRLYDKTGIVPDPKKTDDLLKYVEAVKRQTANDLHNFTRSLGFAEQVGGKTVFKPVPRFYQDCLDFAQLQISSGAVDYNTAIKQAVRKMADSGLRTVDYASGYTNQLDVAVRRSTLTGLSQISGKMEEDAAEELDTDIVETTAHAGARDQGTGPQNHKSWQGKLFSLSGKSKEYPSLREATGYGTVTGLKGANCRHDFHVFVEGVSERVYTDEELRHIDPPPFVYEGVKYDAYDATQMQRKLETAMRRTKREMVGYDAAGLSDEFTASSVKLRRLNGYYKDFSNKARLKTQFDRAQEVGYGKKLSASARSAKSA